MLVACQCLSAAFKNISGLGLVACVLGFPCGALSRLACFGQDTPRQ